MRIKGHSDEIIESLFLRVQRMSGDASVRDFLKLHAQLSKRPSDKMINRQHLIGALAQVGVGSQANLMMNHTTFRLDKLARPSDRNDSDPYKQRLQGVGRNQYIRHCPCCLSDDLARYGYSYFRRTHQLPGVTICDWHNEVLLESSNDALGVLPSDPQAFSTAFRRVYSYEHLLISHQYRRLVDAVLHEPRCRSAEEISAILRAKAKQQGNNVGAPYVPQENTVGFKYYKASVAQAAWMDHSFSCYAGKRQISIPIQINAAISGEWAYPFGFILASIALSQNLQDARDSLIPPHSGCSLFPASGRPEPVPYR